MGNRDRRQTIVSPAVRIGVAFHEPRVHDAHLKCNWITTFDLCPMILSISSSGKTLNGLCVCYPIGLSNLRNRLFITLCRLHSKKVYQF